ncbi:hypothetical protein FB567DRAFT_61721 [Paraphoma chrysanthemicola]|uniref:BHLH domain-containing protein n=1 Tax=Paraphoma chrysanthemicola TaxID=798071 RepID=A0A8K0VYI5_9PLEO|nr:hypothetical protein FB567DRAFT_61721 [Paraphoma chrysanthemicola]
MDSRPPVIGSVPEDRVPQSQVLPSITSLTNNLSPPEQSPVRLRHQSEARDARDSGNWSISQSKHSSTVSNTMGLQLQTLLNPDDSPSRGSVPDTPSSSRYPSGLSQQSNALPPLNHAFENRHSMEASSHFDSRRSSVDSRMNTGMGHLAISPSSPYDTQNASRTSLVSSLNHQRGITGDVRPNGASPLSPLGRNGTSRSAQPPRRAPVINPNPRSVSGMPDPMAAAPTKGYAWAFPGHQDFEPEDRRASSSGESSLGRSNVPTRQNSFATSVNSSIFTTDSKLPPGQQRLDDEIATTHHHSMQHRSVTSLHSPEQAAALAASSGNYSRTPELRISHKMAERKRRSEMKGLFDDLNTILPNSPGSKSSKWEILTKAIEYIRNLASAYDKTRAENAQLRQDAQNFRRAQEEVELLRAELMTTWHQLNRVEPGTTHIYGNFTTQLTQSHHPPSTAPANVLPPLQPQQQQPPPQPQNGQWSNGSSGSMQGVEYGGMRPYEHGHR